LLKEPLMANRLTMADLGQVPLQRIRVSPPPGTAAEEDVLRAESYTGEDQFVELSELQALTGGEVLSGFELPLRSLFAKLDQTAGGR
jgi:hypothetical protein